uniref:Uncharacterized protein n=1 Tax=Desertifilum tharense IPPAS B-1220 TaxID=1781255 RepID=A0ACD5H6E3_9CYAN
MGKLIFCLKSLVVAQRLKALFRNGRLGEEGVGNWELGVREEGSWELGVRGWGRRELGVGS